MMNPLRIVLIYTDQPCIGDDTAVVLKLQVHRVLDWLCYLVVHTLLLCSTLVQVNALNIATPRMGHGIGGRSAVMFMFGHK